MTGPGEGTNYGFAAIIRHCLLSMGKASLLAEDAALHEASPSYTTDYYSTCTPYSHMYNVRSNHICRHHHYLVSLSGRQHFLLSPIRAPEFGYLVGKIV